MLAQVLQSLLLRSMWRASEGYICSLKNKQTKAPQSPETERGRGAVSSLDNVLLSCWGDIAVLNSPNVIYMQNVMLLKVQNK